MSARNGDKARFGTQRKRKIERRERERVRRAEATAKPDSATK